MELRTRFLSGAGILVAAIWFAVALAAPALAGEAKGDLWDKARAESQGKSDTWSSLKEALFPDQTIANGAGVISLTAPYRAADAAVVPITITAAKPQSKDNYIKTLYLIIDENPSPVAAVFHLTPENGRADIATRVRVNKYTNIRAIAEKNDGKFYMVSKFVKATGGCSAPALGDKEAAMARLGKMKLKILKPSVGNEPGRAQLLISHPNYTGLQFDQINRREIPADFVNSIKVSSGDKTLVSIESDISISQNPSIFFDFEGKGVNEISAVVTDSNGRVFKKSWPVTPQVDG